MRHSSIIEPVAIVTQAQQSQNIKHAIFQEEKLDFSSTEDYLYYVTHKVNNVHQPNGRIYLKMVDGKLHANSVSPYADKFWKNIEKGIYPLVKALYDKRYLTYSSCEGHGMDFRRYVGLAFADEKTRQYVANEIAKLKIFGVKTKMLESVCNMKASPHERTHKPQFDKYTEEQRVHEVTQEQETLAFNIQFHRNYENYYFLEIIIFDSINYHYEGIFQEVKKMGLRIVKKLYWDKATRKITEHINSKSFKKYPF